MIHTNIHYMALKKYKKHVQVQHDLYAHMIVQYIAHPWQIHIFGGYDMVCMTMDLSILFLIEILYTYTKFKEQVW